MWRDNEEGSLEAEVKTGDQLSGQQRQELHVLLGKFCTLFSNRPGRTSLMEHDLQTGTARPVKLAPYRIPQAYQETVKQEIRDMLQAGIIEPSNSEWGAPLVLAKKKDVSLRLCVDFRRLNSVSKLDAYPMPRIDDLIDLLGKAKYISTLDLTRGYWQVPLAEEARHKTAFVAPFGLYQFNVMPFGLKGAPATIQRLMDGVIRGLDDLCAAYLDDVIIFSSSWEEHLKHLSIVFARLREAGLTVKPAKCTLGAATCTYLGHMVGNGAVCTEPSKLQAVADFPRPRTKTQVREFLGLTGYYRRFIPNYATLATPLTDLTKKSAPTQVQWTDKCGHAFGKLKERLCSDPVLGSPDFTRPFILQTDASERGVGAVLSQRSAEQGEEHLIAFFSRKLLPREEKYSTIEKECLAIKLAMHAFRTYLVGRHFTVETDHRSLVWLDKLKDSNSRLTRWSLVLQPYDFTVVHRSGSANGNADGLSRTPWPDSSANEFAVGEGGRSVTDFTEVTSRNEDTSQNKQGGQAIRYQNLKEVIRPIASLGFGSNRIRT